MTINPQNILREEAERVAIAGLRSFFNIERVTRLLAERHSVPAKDRHFVQLQAESIRYCLQQALEYRDAALASTFSRPTLVYYSIMSLALCEILFKRDGRFRLAKLREAHGHHGLNFSVQVPPSFKGDVPLVGLSAERLTSGTFAVWFETARHPGFFGTYVDVRGAGKTTGLRQLGAPSPLIEVPERLSLLDLACSCPTMHFEAHNLGIQSQLARATVEVTNYRDQKTVTLDLIIHPAPLDVLDLVWKHIIFSPRCIDLVQPKEFASGGGFSLSYPERADYIGVKLPVTYTLQSGYLLLSSEVVPLNEFGFYYISSYIAGMFARYYPEYWARAVDNSSQTFEVIDKLMSSALSRAPLLLLGELRDSYYVYE
jgi:hypothetical protein